MSDSEDFDTADIGEADSPVGRRPFANQTNSPHAGQRADNPRKDREPERDHSRSRSPEREQAAREAREQAAREAREQASRQKIDRVLSAANSFEVLELSVQEVSEQDVLKAYRVLSLKVHPDKAPADYRVKAEAAFKKLGDAKDELSDSDKQKKLREHIEATRAAEEAEAAREAAKPDLCPWQVDIDTHIARQYADDRDLLFIKGSGGAGMTWMARYTKETYGDRVIVVDYSSARHALLAICEAQDRLNSTGESAIIIFDIVRAGKIDHEFYITAETAKGGLFTVPLKPIKGKSMECKLDHPPAMLVFTNQKMVKQDLENLTADRWNICAIDPRNDELRKMQQVYRWIDEITQARFETQCEEIDDDKKLGDDPNEQLVHDCFEVDADATDELSVRDRLHPVMEDAGYTKSHVCLGILLKRIFKQEINDATIKVKKGGKKGTRYIGLRIKGQAGPP